MRGFISTEKLIKSKSFDSPQCGACGLYKSCNSPKMPVSGKGNKKVLIVAEAPGESEDEEGIQLIGASGKELRRVLSSLGVSLDRDCWKTNAIICRPEDNRKPTKKEIDYCRPSLLKTIEECRPEVIIPLGQVAVRSLIGHLWKSDPGSIGRWAGWTIPSQQLNTWICPTYHPSFLLRKNFSGQVAKIWFRRHLKEAFSFDSRPWTKLPDYNRRIKLFFEPDEAIPFIDDLIRDEYPITFDYETNMLKPDGADAEIVCCSVCNSKGKTIAFPWYGPVIKEMGRLLRSKVPKIAANLKFEDRWTRKEFGHPVRNWIFDTMQGAHVLDNRRAISSVKFQAFVQLGFGVYDEHISSYLKSDASNTPNRIRKLDMRDLLKYCALDSILEYEIAKKQMGLLDVN